MLNRLEVMTALNKIHGKKLQEMGFSPNKGMTIYKLKKEMGEFGFYFNFNRKNFLHLQFAYTHPVVGKKLLEIEDIIDKEKDPSLIEIKKKIMKKIKARPTIVITDWLDFISDNNLDHKIYNKWGVTLQTVEDVCIAKNTYDIIFDLVNKNIINKINNNEDLYKYLEGIKYKNHKNFQNLLILSCLLDNKDIDKVYSEIKKTKSYQKMIKVFADKVDLTFKILKENDF